MQPKRNTQTGWNGGHSCVRFTRNEKFPEVESPEAISGSDTLIRKFVKSIFSSHRKQREKPASGPAAAKGKSKGKRKETVGIAYNGQQKVSAPEEISVERNMIQRRSVNPREKGRVRDRPALHEGIPWRHGRRQETFLQERKEKKGSANLDVSVRSSIRKRLDNR